MLAAKLIKPVRLLLRRAGVDLVRFREEVDENPLRRFLSLNSIDTVLDVGANEGQYAQHLRLLGFQGMIWSFEPGAKAFEALQQTAKRDDKWRCFNYALGESDGEAVLNVSDFSVFSSLLPSNSYQRSLDSRTTIREKQRVQMRSLDSFLAENPPPDGNLMLKLDAQGYERNILLGAEGSLDIVLAVQTELSLHALYDGQPTLEEVVGLLRGSGFDFYTVWEGLCDPQTGHAIEIDAIFFRKPDEETAARTEGRI